jgi:hypothetical protein
MHSADAFAESSGPLKSRDGSSAAPPGFDGVADSLVGAIRVAVALCVAEQRDGIETLGRCVRAARAAGIKPERVVLLIHTAWDEIDSDPGVDAERDRKRLRLTGMALDTYFADQ